MLSIVAVLLTLAWGASAQDPITADDLGSLQLVATIPDFAAGKNTVVHMEFSGNLLVQEQGTGEGTVVLIDITAPDNALAVYSDHGEARFSSDGSFLAMILDGSALKIIDTETLEEIALYRPGGFINRIDISPDDSIVAMAMRGAVAAERHNSSSLM